MEDSNIIVNSLNEWLKAWRGNNNVPPKSVLSGETLSKFIADLQNEIVNVIGDFGKNSIGENAKLVLYSGTHYSFVQKFCEASNGEYYMISQTAADVLENIKIGLPAKNYSVGVAPQMGRYRRDSHVSHTFSE